MNGFCYLSFPAACGDRSAPDILLNARAVFHSAGYVTLTTAARLQLRAPIAIECHPVATGFIIVSDRRDVGWRGDLPMISGNPSPAKSYRVTRGLLPDTRLTPS